MKIQSKWYFFVICLLSVVVFTTCKPKQRIVYSTTPVEDKAYNELFKDVINHEFPYRTFTAKLNMGMTSGTQTFSSKANIRIVKDEALQISVQPLFGVEVFRFYISPDSVFLLDRMNKRYVLESMDVLKEHFPVGFDYYTMQSLFTNALFVSGKSEINAGDYRSFNYDRTSDQNFQMTAKDDESGIDYSFTVNGDDRITFTHLMQPEKKYFMQWGYQNFVLLNSALFPHKMDMTLTSATRKIDAELLFSEVVTDVPFQLAMNVPQNYTKTSVAEILKILSPKRD